MGDKQLGRVEREARAREVRTLPPLQYAAGNRGYVRAGDQQHELHGAENDPEHAPHASDEVFLERMHVRAELHASDVFEAHPARVSLHRNRNQSLDVGIGVFEAHTGTCDTLVACRFL